MKNLKKLFSLLLALTMVLSMAACGSGEPPNKTQPADDTQTEGGGKIYNGVKLVYWSNWEAAETQGKIITEAVNEFMAETGAEVDLQFKGRTGIKRRPDPGPGAALVKDHIQTPVQLVLNSPMLTDGIGKTSH